MDIHPIDRLITSCREAAARTLRCAAELTRPAVVVHHNDADGIAAAATLSLTFRRLSLPCRLLALEKIHAAVLEKIHGDAGEMIIYADLGGQSAHIIGRCAVRSPLVVILDHHLPGGAVPANVVHLNPEIFGISGDTEASAASVSALYGIELLKEASLCSPRLEAMLAALGVLGAVGDGHLQPDGMTGINAQLMAIALEHTAIVAGADGFVFPRFGGRTAREIVAILNLLGSVGFYGGHARKGVAFLLGRNTEAAVRLADDLLAIKNTAFAMETERIRKGGLLQTSRFQWVHVADRFAPMGVKAIGLFLEALIAEGISSRDKYLIGFQHLPVVMPAIGDLRLCLSKVSGRVGPGLTAAIRNGNLPDYMTLMPAATAMVGGTADGCHRFAAAALINRGDEEAFIMFLESTLRDYLTSAEQKRPENY